MLIILERFGQTYTFETPEGVVPVDGQEDSSEEPQFEEVPEICIIDAVEALNNLLRCVFPEMEGHHLELICDRPEDEIGGKDYSKNLPTNDGGIDLGTKLK